MPPFLYTHRLRLAFSSLLVLALAGRAPAQSTAGRAPAQSTAGNAPAQFTAGQTYFGTNNYVEYRAGDAPLLLSAPHGGALLPNNIPDRTCPDIVTVTDANTVELVRAIDNAFIKRFSCRPHLVISHLKRIKLDPNRDLPEASCGNAIATQAWTEYHQFLDAAASKVASVQGQRGLLLDVHGHGHAIARIELGYLLSGAQLLQPDASLPPLAAATSIWGVASNQPNGRASLPALLRGPNALGTQLANRGYPSVPSQQDPAPQPGQEYFRGGYTIERHGSATLGGPIDAIQAETYSKGLRDTPAARSAFAAEMALTLGVYLRLYYGWTGCRPQARATAPMQLSSPLLELRTSPGGATEIRVAPEYGATRLRVYDLRGVVRFQGALGTDGAAQLPLLLAGIYITRLEWPNGQLSRAQRLLLP